MPSEHMEATKVVIVDDHLAINELIVDVISAEKNCRVVGSAQSEAEALALCVREQPDVVVLDLILTEGSGMRLLEEIRVSSPRSKVVVFSGNLMPEFVRRVLALGVLGVVAKMSPLSEFRNALRAAIEGKSYYSRDISEMIKDLVARPIRNSDLTEREKTVLKFLAQGLSSKQIAEKLGVSVHTVINHRSHLMKKTGLRRGTQLSLYAAGLGLVTSETLNPYAPDADA